MRRGFMGASLTEARTAGYVARRIPGATGTDARAGIVPASRPRAPVATRQPVTGVRRTSDR